MIAPAPNVFLGKYEEGQVNLEGTEPTGETAVHLGPFDLDVLRSLASGRVRSEARSPARSEEEVSGIAASYAVPPVRSVELEEGSITVGSEVEVHGDRLVLPARQH